MSVELLATACGGLRIGQIDGGNVLHGLQAMMRVVEFGAANLRLDLISIPGNHTD